MNIEIAQLVLALLWVALMLIYLLGDVLRIFSGNFVPGEIDGEPAKDSMWVAAAVMMVIPILMVLVSLFIPLSVTIWATIIASTGFLVMNLVGLKGYKLFDQILLVLSFGINGITIFYAWSLL